MRKLFAFLSGIIITQSALAEYTCDISVSDYYLLYELDSYTCSAGQYLPANTLGCVTCPNGFTCNGGTFEFNSDEYQGIDSLFVNENTMNNVCASNFPSDLYLVYEPNSHVCSSGYYLPAGVDACTICPMNSVCAGGTYSFNETLAQGIQSCANGTFAPTGSTVCYPHILHVGNDVVYLKSTKQTTPSLNLRIGGDVFYANMTTVRTRMSKDSSHYLHAKTADNIHYYICDDTTYGK